jgi:hypothetical protein
MGGIMATAFAPLVKNEQRDQWEAYAIEHQGWIEQSAYLKHVHPQHLDALHGTLQDPEHDYETGQNHDEDHEEEVSEGHGEHKDEEHEEEHETDPDHDTHSISHTIYRWDELGQHVPEVRTSGQLLAPLWQVSPVDSGAVNANLLADLRVAKLYTTMLKTNEGVVGGNKGVLSSNFEVGNLVCVGRIF